MAEVEAARRTGDRRLGVGPAATLLRAGDAAKVWAMLAAAEGCSTALPPAIKAATKAVGARGGGGIAAAAAAAAPLVGKRVRIDGLAGRAELNGLCGIAFTLDGERYGIRVDGSGECVRLKPANLRETKGEEPRIVEVAANVD